MLDREGVVGGGNWGVVVVVEVVRGGVDVVGWLVVGDAAMGPLGVGGIESVMVIDCRVDKGRCMCIYMVVKRGRKEGMRLRWLA